MRKILCILVTLSVAGISECHTFPPNFMFGVATASYQVEGAWNYDGKGVNIWDTLTHDHPEYVEDRSNGDIATNSYYMYKEDVQLLKQLEVNFYRFSISWSRILPNGHINQVNQAGIDFYNNFINELIANGIEPVVTMFHWDLPQTLQDIGGLSNIYMVDIFVDYARLLFEKFGDRVKWWTTFNEPAIIAYGYTEEDGFAPSIDSAGIGNYLTIRTMLLAHAKTYHIYKQDFYESQQGKIGVVMNAAWYEPMTNSTKHVEAHERAMQFYLGLYAHPIHSEQGNYPDIVKDRIANRSMELGFFKSRLPAFSEEQVKYIRGTFDYFGLNHYTTYLVSPSPADDRKIPSLEDDLWAARIMDPKWPATAGRTRKVVPWGIRKLLNWIKDEYNNPPVFICENGMADRGEKNDTLRIYYYTHYINEVLNALAEDECNVIAYTGWSFLDNFEWTSGYTQKFGLYHVDFNDPARTRTPKESAKVFTEIIRNRQVPAKYLQDL